MRLILSPFVPRNQMIPRIYQSSDLCEINQGRDQEVCLPLGPSVGGCFDRWGAAVLTTQMFQILLRHDQKGISTWYFNAPLLSLPAARSINWLGVVGQALWGLLVLQVITPLSGSNVNWAVCPLCWTVFAILPFPRSFNRLSANYLPNNGRVNAILINFDMQVEPCT